MAAAVLGSAMMVGLLGASSAFAVRPKEPLHASFKLKGSHHYEISGLGYGYATFYATLTASRGHGSAQYVGSAGPGEYTGSASAKRMALDLGSRGGYDLRFHRKKTKMIDPPKGCTGEQVKARIGVWKGRINFRAEGGYTSVHARRARGRVVPEHVEWRCPFVKGTAILATGFSLTSIPPVFTAFKPDNASATRFAVLSAWDPVPAKGATVLARRHAAVHGTSGQFMFTPGLTGAQVNPPAPFSGSGRYSKSGTNWSGSLAVDFPGEANYPITESNDFGASLIHDRFPQPCDGLICRNYP
jgi:hypothetical protein